MINCSKLFFNNVQKVLKIYITKQNKLLTTNNVSIKNNIRCATIKTCFRLYFDFLLLQTLSFYIQNYWEHQKLTYTKINLCLVCHFFMFHNLASSVLYNEDMLCTGFLYFFKLQSLSHAFTKLLAVRKTKLPSKNVSVKKYFFY